MKNSNSLFLIILAIYTSSCSSYLTPNMTGDNNIGYLPRPVNAEEKKSKIYVSGEYNYSAPKGDLEMKSGLISLSRGHSLKNLNFAYGVFGFFGDANYQDTTTLERGESRTIENFNKSFYGFGLRSTIGLHYVRKDFTFRYINWENAFSTEKGEYANYRKILFDGPNMRGNQNIAVSKEKVLYTTGLSTEIICNNAFNENNSQFGLRLFVGFTPNLKNTFKRINNGAMEETDNKFAINVSTYFKVKRIFANVQLGSEINTSLKAGLGYSF
ncbi:hypothetical protein A5893_06915 [Pedobacter psychrophilus]|uniref:Uncharacterized protein n=1 Tax=Pedobacter psychrophilus TaxID=1826909 RepID=A0A179DHY9_9SPHI|nr:hypothetical protein [Pedobacter psychrophilus]OAQ40665.1 hypothetical protein A5893_06915 [Pedobacter psychrophilus]